MSVPALAYLCPLSPWYLALACYWERAAARVLLAYLLLWFLEVKVPGIFLSPSVDILVVSLQNRGDGSGHLGTVCLVRR